MGRARSDRAGLTFLKRSRVRSHHMAMLGSNLPIVQAPMANITTAALVAEACEAGALGTLGSALMPPPVIEVQVAAVRARTSRPFGLNFFCHAPPDLSAWPDIPAPPPPFG